MFIYGFLCVGNTFILPLDVQASLLLLGTLLFNIYTAMLLRYLIHLF